MNKFGQFYRDGHQMSVAGEKGIPVGRVYPERGGVMYPRGGVGYPRG